MLYSRPQGEHFYPQFMPGNARKIKERKLAQITTDIGTAYTHAMRSYERHPRSGRIGLGDLDPLEFFRGENLYRSHVGLIPKKP
jgi:hypothetical protein